ncbi:MAG: hemolysin family protein [Mangrovibacterium sp.]
MEILFVILGSIIFSVFFSGMEVAFVSANKLRLELDKKQQSLHSRILTTFTRKSGQYMATMLIGKYISLVIYGLAFFRLTESIFSFVDSDVAALFIQVVCATLIILVTSELLPRTLFRLNPNMILRVSAVPLILFYYLLYPFSKLLIGFSGNIFTKTYHSSENRESEKFFFSRTNLDHFIDEQQDHVSVQQEDAIDNEVKLFRNAMDFSKVKLREIMVPRTEITAIDINSSFEDLRQKFIETGYSRILFYQDNIDNIIGYIHHSTIFSNPESIRSALKTVLIVPETMSASKLLSIFIQQHRSIAIVVDEFGGTSGMVTSEDILEEIFGEIEDEHDTIDWVEKQVGEDEYIFSARIDLDVLNEKYDLGFPLDENYETLAGYILFYHESIPKINTVITIGKFRFKILKATNTRIELVNLKIIPGTK